MSYFNMYLNGNAGASNLNSGSTCSDVGGGSDSPTYSGTGDFDGTSIFTPNDGSTPANTVSVGMYAALYNTGDTVCRAVAQITNVAAGVGGAITVSTTIKYGTVPTNSGVAHTRAIKVGGAFADLGIANGATSVFGATVALPQSTILNCKAGTYASTTNNRVFNMTAVATLEFWIRGYRTTPGDQDSNNVAAAGTDIPSFTFTTGSLSLPGTAIMSSVDITGAKVGSQLVLAANSTIYRTRITNTSSNASANAVSMSQQCALIACNLACTSTTANAVTTAANTIYEGCTITGGAGGLVHTTATSVVIVNNVFITQSGDAIQFSTGGGIIAGNTIYQPTGNGVNWTGTPGQQCVVSNNLFHSVSQGSKSAINNTSVSSTSLIKCIGNAYYNCTANITGIVESFAVFDNGTLGTDPLPNAASGNFTIDPSAFGLGFPGKNTGFENISAYKGYMSPGAVQPNTATSASACCSQP